MQTVNINGSDANDLTSQWAEVIRAAQKLTVALARATPHGRDFLPQGGDMFLVAYDEHRRICNLVEQVHEYACANFENILGQKEDWS